MRVELLYFDGCPGYESLLPRVQALLTAMSVSDDVAMRRIETPEEAIRERFLGSPSLRIDGQDVEPGAGEREDFGLKCRLYSGDDGISGVPPEAWIKAAIQEAGGMP